MRDNWHFPVQPQHFVSLDKLGIRLPTVTNILARDDSDDAAPYAQLGGRGSLGRNLAGVIPDKLDRTFRIGAIEWHE